MNLKQYMQKPKKGKTKNIVTMKAPMASRISVERLLSAIFSKPRRAKKNNIIKNVTNNILVILQQLYPIGSKGVMKHG